MLQDMFWATGTLMFMIVAAVILKEEYRDYRNRRKFYKK